MKIKYFIILIVILLVIYYIMTLSNEINTYQHNSNVLITKENYTYVYEYKKQLLQNITNLLNELKIRFVIADGNLIEYERGQPILHDDDIDIRISVDDINIWFDYIKTFEDKNYIDEKYNLSFDRLENTGEYVKSTDNVPGQKNKWIKTRLHKINNITNLKTFPQMNINADLVTSDMINSFWITWKKYNIDYNNLRKITYLDVDTYAPSKEDTIRVLTTEYGPNYLIPNKKYTSDIMSWAK